MNDYYLELIRQTPINYNGLIFYPIPFQYICDNIGLDLFDELLVPFCVTKDCFKISEELYDETDLFDDIIMHDDVMLKCIGRIIQLFCMTDDVRRYNDGICVVTTYNEEENMFVINKQNFEDIAAIIRKINGKDKIKVEKPPKNMSARQKDVWDKLQEGRRKEAKKNEVHIYDMLNVCEFGGNYRIPEEELEKWTLWKIMNCYKARVGMKSYEDNLKICLVSGDGKEISGDKHWHSQLMIRD